jgi:nucleoside-diphosphate-sugar epimerase
LNKHISIIGCGWLGLPLAKKFIENGYVVKGSTTSVEKLALLKSIGINPYLVSIDEENIEGDIANCLDKSDIAIINIPPGLRKHTDANFVKRIQNLMTYLETSTVSKIVFVSSTSVYADEIPIPVITEESPTHPETESGKQLLEVESLLQENTHFETTIVRFGGLIGDDRHPANSLAGKTQLKNPDAPVNLIHQQDAISSIVHIIENNAWNDLFIVVNPSHPTRKIYYTEQCKQRDLPLPEFDESETSKGKIINSEKLQNYLNYKFQIDL